MKNIILAGVLMLFAVSFVYSANYDAYNYSCKHFICENGKKHYYEIDIKKADIFDLGIDTYTECSTSNIKNKDIFYVQGENNIHYFKIWEGKIVKVQNPNPPINNILETEYFITEQDNITPLFVSLSTISVGGIASAFITTRGIEYNLSKSLYTDYGTDINICGDLKKLCWRWSWDMEKKKLNKYVPEWDPHTLSGIIQSNLVSFPDKAGNIVLEGWFSFKTGEFLEANYEAVGH